MASATLPPTAQVTTFPLDARLRTGRVSAQQHRWRVMLHQMGFGYYVIDTDAQLMTLTHRAGLRRG